MGETSRGRPRGSYLLSKKENEYIVRHYLRNTLFHVTAHGRKVHPYVNCGGMYQSVVASYQVCVHCVGGETLLNAENR